MSVTIFSECSDIFKPNCFSAECVSNNDVARIGIQACSNDLNCGGEALVCEKESRPSSGIAELCTLKSLRNTYYNLPCLQDDDCCADNDYNYCCLWVNGQYGKLHFSYFQCWLANSVVSFTKSKFNLKLK